MASSVDRAKISSGDLGGKHGIAETLSSQESIGMIDYAVMLGHLHVSRGGHFCRLFGSP